MRKIPVILLVFSLFIYGQEVIPDNEINVREIVQQQIDNARKRESKAKVYLLAEKNDAVKQNVNTTSQFFVDDVTFQKIGFLILFSISIFSYIAIRRKKISGSNGNNILKKNIKLMREEKFIKPIDPKLKKIRTSLCLTSKNLNASERDITDTAKKYNIAKSELLLAAKFNKQTAGLNY